MSLPQPKRSLSILAFVLLMTPDIHALAPDKPNPHYNLVNIRALDWLPQSVTGLAWLGPDTLVVAEFGGVKPMEQFPTRKGALHLLTGVMKAKGPGDVKRTTIAQGLAQPI